MQIFFFFPCSKFPLLTIVRIGMSQSERKVEGLLVKVCNCIHSAWNWISCSSRMLFNAASGIIARDWLDKHKPIKDISHILLHTVLI